MTRTIHATAVSVRGSGVLIFGPSGSGKSDLALRLIDRGATLIADDRVTTELLDGELLLSPPPTLAGLMEVRGIGIVAMPHVEAVAAALVIELAEPERMPEPRTILVEGVNLPTLAVMPFEHSAAIKVELAVAQTGKQS